MLDPWLDHEPVRLYGPDDLAARIAEVGATVVICEADSCSGAVLEQPLVAIGSTRGDPTNVDVGAATAAGIPVLHTPGRNADAVAEMTVALLLAVTRHVVAGDRDIRAGTVFGTTSPTSATGPGSWRDAPPASSGSVPSDGRPGGGSRASACG